MTRRPAARASGLLELTLARTTVRLNGVTPTWGASGSTGAFLYYSKDRNLYVAGTINSINSLASSFILMGATMTLFKSQ